MKVLIVGNGAREHVLAWKIKQSPKVSEVFIAPGNGGTEEFGTNVDIKVENIEGLLAFAKENKIDLTVVGPEVPLVIGIVDTFVEAGLRVFGPGKAAAELEGSKAYSKEFMEKYGIPTAMYKEFTLFEEAMGSLRDFNLPLVIKADGLAAGKGVYIPETYEEAEKILKEIMVDKKFGSSGDKIIIEEFLTGIEASIICFVDGKTIVPMEAAQDYKKIYDNDLGLNTGGMGSYSPSVIFNDEIKAIVDAKVLQPFIQGVKAENFYYRGMVFIGLMIEGTDIKVLEFNVRFGDPETQSLLPRLETDLIDIIESVEKQELDKCQIKWTTDKCVTVVLASEGYPEDYEKGHTITGLDKVVDSHVFHAGTIKSGGLCVTNGGRVLSVTKLAKTLDEAREAIYRDIDKIDYMGKVYRRDIAKF